MQCYHICSTYTDGQYTYIYRYTMARRLGGVQKLHHVHSTAALDLKCELFFIAFKWQIKGGRHMEASKNGGYCTPKSSNLIGCSSYWGSPIYGNPM